MKPSGTTMHPSRGLALVVVVVAFVRAPRGF
jgi:hypothetical protein